ncbi:hypothetical protein [Burkholderia metallica]|uniref:hypothetical protein n=1 Tax=Burkholderia metallica TaxID=488729 RepID=UPI00158D333F|nr:hypothetical protein [Burkholderia metallica]
MVLVQVQNLKNEEYKSALNQMIEALIPSETPTTNNWEVGFFNGVAIKSDKEFNAWNEKMHQDWFELTGEQVDLHKFISEYELEEMKKSINDVHVYVEKMSIKTPGIKLGKTWTSGSFGFSKRKTAD